VLHQGRQAFVPTRPFRISGLLQLPGTLCTKDTSSYSSEIPNSFLCRISPARRRSIAPKAVEKVI